MATIENSIHLPHRDYYINIESGNESEITFIDKIESYFELFLKRFENETFFIYV